MKFFAPLDLLFVWSAKFLETFQISPETELKAVFNYNSLLCIKNVYVTFNDNKQLNCDYVVIFQNEDNSNTA